MCAPYVIASVRDKIADSPIRASSPANPQRSSPLRNSTSNRRHHTGGVIDLTHRLTPDFPLFPGIPPMRFDVIARVDTDGWYEGVLTIDEHTGTHVDAPAHFADNGATIDLVPAERLVAP